MSWSHWGNHSNDLPRGVVFATNKLITIAESIHPPHCMHLGICRPWLPLCAYCMAAVITTDLDEKQVLLTLTALVNVCKSIRCEPSNMATRVDPRWYLLAWILLLKSNVFPVSAGECNCNCGELYYILYQYWNNSRDRTKGTNSQLIGECVTSRLWERHSYVTRHKEHCQVWHVDILHSQV